MPNEQIVRTTLQIDADIANFEKGLQQIQQSLNQLQLPKGFADSINQRMGSIRGTLSKLKELTEGGLIDKKDISTVNNLVNTITKSFSALQTKLSSEGIAEAGLKKDQAALLALTKLQKDYQRSVAATDKEEERLTNELEKQKKKREEIQRAQQQRIKDNDKYAEKQVALESARRAKNEAIRAQRDAKEAARARIEASGGKYSGVTDPNFKKTNEGQQLKKAIVDATKAVQAYEQAVLEAEKYTSDLAEKQAFEKVDKEINNATQALKEYQDTGKNIDQAAALDETLSKFKEIKDIDFSNYGIDESAINSFEELEQSIDQVNIKAQQNRQVVGTEMAAGLGIAKTANENLAQATENSTQAIDEQNERAKNVTGVLNRIKQFVGLAGATMTFRRVAQDAISTIKELDKQMTEMAVVTNLDVGDYWEQLPEYTKRANELGVSIKSAYEAATLYYQQGLKNNEVVQVSNSTLKMARIAGLNAAEATDRMTAALRGFNMEVTQTNADRVADVYSKLAAITASNVNEISVAMTKTASIASNANMQFETTAAFLSQIIETTRESAETAGTALKTVIARFQELKKDPAEIGEVDGEIVDANKIETALRSVDVALRDTNGQFRDLDQVFLELASKWDGLDTNTQRYIATIAAGSRQQSRFIAMMSNYSRTTELVTAANNAAGTSNQQFEKTLDSLESKLAKLSNAWHEFTMGLVNNELIKGGIDLLTDIFNILNKITQGWDSWSGGALKIGLVTAALYAGDKALNIFLNHFKKGETIFASLKATAIAPLDAIKTRLTSINKTRTIININSTQMNQATVAAQAYKNATSQLNAEAAENKILQEQQNKSLAEYATILGLTTPEAQTALNLESLGVDTKTAAILATKGYSKQLLEEMAAKSGVEVATMAKILAGTQENATTARGIIQTKAATLATKFSGKGKLKEAIYTKLLAISNAAATGTTKALAGAIWSLVWPMLLVVAAIGALVLGIIAIVKAVQEAKKNSPEGQLETAKKTLEEVTQAANDTAEAYNNLSDSLSGLNDKYEKINELTAGTREWKDAVYEVNQQVLDLINKYPELAKAYSLDENGVFRLTNESIQDSVLNKVQQEKFIKANAQAVANINVQQAQDRVKALDLVKTQTWLGRGGHSLLVSNEQKEEIVDAIARQLASTTGELNTQSTEQDVINFINSKFGDLELPTKYLDEFAKATVENIDAIRAFGKELEGRSSDTYRGAAAGSVNMMNLESMSNVQREIITAVTTSAVFEDALKTVEINNDQFDTWRKEEYENSRIKKGYIQQQDEDGKWQNVISIDAAKTLQKAEMASKKVAETEAGQLKVINSLSSATKEVLTSQEGQNLRYGMLEGLSDKIKEDLSTLPDVLQTSYQTIYKDNLEIANNLKNAFNQQWGSIIQSNSKYLDKATVSALSKLGDNYAFVLNKTGIDGVKLIDEALSTVTENLTNTQTDALLTQLNAISNWSDLANWDNIYSTLNAFDIVINNDLINLINTITTAAKATYNINTEEAQKRFQTQNKLLEEILQEGKRTFNDEEYQLLSKMIPEQLNNFILGLDGNMTYIGTSLSTLTTAIQENTNALLGSGFDQLQVQLELKSQIEESTKLQDAINKSTGTSVSDKQNYLLNVQSSFSDLSLWYQLFGSTNITSMDEKTINNIIDTLKSINNSDFKTLSNSVSNAAQGLSLKDRIAYLEGFSELSDASNPAIKSVYKSVQDALVNSLVLDAQKNNIGQTIIDNFRDEIEKFGFNTNKNAISEFLTKLYNAPFEQYTGIEAQLQQRLKELQNEFDSFDDKLELLSENQSDTIDSLDKINTIYADQLTNYQDQYDTLRLLYEQEDKNLNSLVDSDTFKELPLTFDQTTGQFTFKPNASVSQLNQEQKQLLEKVQASFDSLQNIKQQMTDVEINYAKIQKKSRSDYLDLLSKIRDAEINSRQEQIDKLTELNNTVKSVQDDLISGVRDALSEDRQLRSQEEQLKEIEDRETRLSYLLAESGGGNQLEILQLQKEIDEATRDYQDNLIDNQIASMEKASEEAFNQREKQIEIQQNQLDWWKEQYSWEEVEKNFDKMLENSPLQLLQALMKNDGSISNLQKGINVSDYIGQIKSAKGYNSTNLAKPEQVSLKDQIGTTSPSATLSGIISKIPKIYSNMTDQEKQSTAVGIAKAAIDNTQNVEWLSKLTNEGLDAYVKEIDWALNNLEAGNEIPKHLSEKQGLIESKDRLDQEKEKRNHFTEYQTYNSKQNEDPKSSIRSGLLNRGETVYFKLNETTYKGDIRNQPFYRVGWSEEKQIVKEAEPGQVFIVGEDQLAIRGYDDNINWLTTVTDIGGELDKKQELLDKLRFTQYDFSNEMHEMQDLLLKYGYINSRFKTGGLADFTGPAWLDGTPSAPELVLNSTDTKNFIALRDILAETMRGSTITNNNDTTTNGDTYVDVDINVDSIDGDYDVEQLAQQVQQIITRDSTYRNPNAVNTVR